MQAVNLAEELAVRASAASGADDRLSAIALAELLGEAPRARGRLPAVIGVEGGEPA